MACLAATVLTRADSSLSSGSSPLDKHIAAIRSHREVLPGGEHAGGGGNQSGSAAGGVLNVLRVVIESVLSGVLSERLGPAGSYDPWLLAPCVVRLAPVSSRQMPYIRSLHEKLTWEAYNVHLAGWPAGCPGPRAPVYGKAASSRPDHVFRQAHAAGQTPTMSIGRRRIVGG